MKYTIALAVILAVVVGSQAGCYQGNEEYNDGQIKDKGDKYCKCDNNRITCGACQAMGEVFDGRKDMGNGAYCICAEGRVGCVGKKRSLEDDAPVDNSVRNLMELLKKNL